METLTQRRLIAQAARAATAASLLERDQPQPPADERSAAAFALLKQHAARYVAAATPQLCSGRLGLDFSNGAVDVDRALLLTQLDDVLKAVVIGGMPMFPPDDLAADRAAVASRLLDAADAFVAGLRSHAATVEDPTAPIAAVFAADAAATHGAGARDAADDATQLAGIAAYFAVLQLFDACVTSLQGCVAEARAAAVVQLTSSDRINALMTAFVARHDAATARRGLLLATSVTESLESAWTALAPRWRRMFGQNVRVAAMWR